jgi:rare lipoprotein A
MRRRMAHVLAVVISVASLGAAAKPEGAAVRPKVQRAPVLASMSVATKGPKMYQVGPASWYGSDFHGKATASGEPYDMFDMTAAHPFLPMNTWVRVTSLRNGRSVVVRINDRGPVVPGRIIDLSYRAARMLEMRATGVQRVRLELVPPQTVAMLRE